jgi:hypothetical protein
VILEAKQVDILIEELKQKIEYLHDQAAAGWGQVKAIAVNGLGLSDPGKSGSIPADWDSHGTLSELVRGYRMDAERYRKLKAGVHKCSKEQWMAMYYCDFDSAVEAMAKDQPKLSEEGTKRLINLLAISKQQAVENNETQILTVDLDGMKLSFAVHPNGEVLAVSRDAHVAKTFIGL